MNSVQGKEEKSFNEILIGDKAEFQISVDEQMHSSFASLFGDYSPIHTDSEFCKRTRFEGRIGNCFMFTGFLSRLYGEYLPGGSSLCIKQESQFIRPFFIGDQLTVKAEVIDKMESTRFVEIKSEIFRENGERIFKGKGIVQVRFEKHELYPLFSLIDGYIYYQDFVDAFRKLGITQGETIYVTSDISVFGKLATLDKNFLLNSIIESLMEAVGDQGTIIMPTFSYSFCNNEIFNLTETKSTVGVLTDYFRQRPDVVRTRHPIFSAAIWGKNKDFFLDIGHDSFDDQSIFGKLRKAQAKLVFLGAPFHSCTYLHHIEQMHGCDYRYIKKFSGIIKENDNEYTDEYTFLVRYLDKNVTLNTDRIEKNLLENRMLKQVNLGNGIIESVSVEDLFNEGIRMLDKDPYFFLEGEPK